MPVLRPGEVVQSERGEGRWQVERKIGEGQFSEVYSVVEQDTQVQVSGGGRRRRSGSVVGLPCLFLPPACGRMLTQLSAGVHI